MSDDRKELINFELQVAYKAVKDQREGIATPAAVVRDVRSVLNKFSEPPRLGSYRQLISALEEYRFSR
ncbi:hypothetical protein [Nitratireductor sp. XY-223]|uniref:hypothetical protein n=1 Tax=Nitratireductor sp. XY-223 TaxID=2561926 RepID=UPI0010A9CF5C|nr:hypothetical protein [Nitratireductor sp. XY-223]